MGGRDEGGQERAHQCGGLSVVRRLKSPCHDEDEGNVHCIVQ